MRKPFNQDWPLTQKFGENPDIYKKFKMAGHNGLDYGLPNGTELVAPISGKVIEAVRSGDPGYGKYIKIENDREGSLVAHLKSVDVDEGDEVVEGQHIGLSDNTGFSFGPHLHWGYYRFPRDRSNGFAGYIDQLPILESAGASETFLGKPKDYWLQVEKDREELLKKEGELKTQVHELSNQLEAEREKSKTLKEFVGDLARLLNVPEDQAEIRKAIVEDMAQIDSISRLTQELENSKINERVISEKAAKFEKTVHDLTAENQGLLGALDAAKEGLAKVEAEYKVLLSTIGTPLWKYRIRNFLLALFRAE